MEFLRKSCFLIFLIHSQLLLFCQKSNDIEVRDLNNNILPYAWCGGMNAPQFSEIDLNDDAFMDLFVFDREGNRVMTFINGGSAGNDDYQYAPEYETKFPPMQHWALLVDYNNDGLADIFTYNGGGIKVYKNTSSGGNVSFSLKVFPYLVSNPDNGSQPSNIYVSDQDIPAIADVDFDGDVDVLAFGLSSEYVWFYENFAIDSGSLETFRFHDHTYCWGNFKEAPGSNKVTLNMSCPKAKSQAKGNKHSGSTILAFDPDGDQDMDLLLGDRTYPSMIFLENGGNKFNANMVAQDTSFPSYNTPIDLRIFPAAFYLDVNNDSKKDLLISPNALAGIENYQSVCYYKNTGTSAMNIFSYQTNNFLHSSMIDLGTQSYPVLFDHNFDGLLDLIVGNGGYYLGQNFPLHSLALFENTGTLTNPSFKLVDTNYANIGQHNLNTILNKPTFNIVPAFNDINSDGSVDMVIGDFQGRLHHYQNDPMGGKSNFVLINVNYESIDVGSFASPFLTDLNGDGLTDIIAGQQNGHLDYYINKGTKFDPQFDVDAEDDSLGEVNTTPAYEYDGFSQARFYRTQGDFYMLSGSKSGTIYRYGNILENLDGKFDLLDSIYLGIDAGSRSHVEIGDINGDGKFEIITGNSGGGLSFYYTNEFVGVKEVNSAKSRSDDLLINWLPDQKFLIFLQSPEIGTMSIHGLPGQEIENRDFNGREILDMSSYTSGVYLVTVRTSNAVYCKKILLAK